MVKEALLDRIVASRRPSSGSRASSGTRRRPTLRGASCGSVRRRAAAPRPGPARTRAATRTPRRSFPAAGARRARPRWRSACREPGMEPLVPRVTMTLPVFNAARRSSSWSPGEDKAEAVARAFGGEPDPDAPASLVQPGGTLTRPARRRRGARCLESMPGDQASRIAVRRAQPVPADRRLRLPVRLRDRRAGRAQRRRSSGCACRGSDSPSVFGAILDRDAGALPARARPTWTVPAGRRYLPGTNVLETSWMTRMGWLIVRDALLRRPVAPRERALEHAPPLADRPRRRPRAAAHGASACRAIVRAAPRLRAGVRLRRAARPSGSTRARATTRRSRRRRGRRTSSCA